MAHKVAEAYKLEDLTFLHMKKEKIYVSNPSNSKGLTIFEIEKTLTEKEKLEIIDLMREGVGSYLKTILEKWEDEKDTLKKDQYGNPLKVSKKAWIKKNDPRGIINIEYSLGNYWLFKTKYKELSLNCPTTDYGYNMEYTGQPVVHQWFHDLCVELHREEKKYFKKSDPKQIKLAKVREFGNQYRIQFDNQDINDIVWNNKEDVTEERLDAFIAAYEELEVKIQEIATKVNK